MKNLILDDCDHLIKFILFGNDDDGKKAKLHIPRNIFWKKKKYVDDDTESEKIMNVMELAIYHCKGREIKDTIIVAYLLEYYSMHAKDYVGWMSTVSKALPLLFKYHYYPYNIIQEEYLELRNLGSQFRAFEFMKQTLALQVVPLPDLLEIYKIGQNEKNKLSPFARVVQYGNNDDIYDNPATEAIIDFLSWAYLDHSTVINYEVMSIMIGDYRYSNGFGGVEKIDTGLIALVAFAVFFFGLKGLVLGYILLTESKKTKDSFNGTTTNPLNGQELNVKMKANFDPTDRNDNSFSYYPTAMVATYFWLNGDFVQRDLFDFWAVEVFSLIASILLVTILQNMLITFMGGVYEEAATKGRQALFRANQIANYEAFYHLHFPPIEHDPKYIYYIGQSKNFETWRENRKDDGAIYKGFEEKSTFTKFKIEEIENINNVSGIIELLIKKLNNL
ncbi:hypothetical protein RhiirA4_476196 [Rhizophagus irregularis]|uniref:Ion transport domain-containing protein n=1 Tax=Rhizophagus irregularis TaxID=588596 RepID=A0A2I1HB77_9GLOM|nr:hypothetical protein RhiirA4_476196 [Rhizophagus irregularis]